MPKKYYSLQSGFSLIEVLVSLVIISLGILGVTGMLIKGLNNAKTSNMRTMAALQASSLASAMYANRQFWGNATAGISFSSDADGNATAINISIPTSPDATACGNAAAVCKPAAMAGNDARFWINSVKNTLAQSATNVICGWDPGANSAIGRSNCEITISWNETFIDSSKNPASDSAATSGTRSYVLHVEP